jgi:hypothetical protein
MQNKELTEKEEEKVPEDESRGPSEGDDGEPAVEVDESVFAADAAEEELPEFDE